MDKSHLDKSRSLWHISTDQSVIKESEHISDEAECVVKSRYSLISTGTERLVARGKVPVSLQEHMQVPYMEGDFSLPIKYGYSLVGKVVEGPTELNDKMVHLLHPHQDICHVKAADLSIVPFDIPAARATLASNMETALNAVWDSEVSIGDRVLLVGFGIIGSLTASLLRAIPGVELSVYDTNQQRCEMAAQMGFHVVDNFQPYDLAFHCSGSGEGLQLCIDQIGKEGKVIEMSWYGEQEVSLQLGRSFHYQRKQIISSQVSHIPVKKQHRWDYQRRKAVVMELLKNPEYDQYIGASVAFDKAPELFNKIRKGELSALSWVIDYT
ncbi:zinc-binding alcohol dehydrogenase [Catalinimonas sp. 4WD22]|uniref:zinc-dependent alcohol dehydrogenase n=1 Tax=Catalinimonas locisalis TaxID=3133978 RepID=UPI003100CDB4